MARKLLLVDASNSIYRAFFALPALANSSGVPTHATLGFTTMLQKLLRESRPDCVAVIWEGQRQRRRKELYADYKATRDAAPDDLRAQIPWIRRIVDAYRLATVEYEGEEADDVIATLSRAAERAGYEVEIASTDRDLLQLVSDTIHVVDTMRDRRFGPAEVEARFGVPPAQVLDLRALVGDSSDNIPGVKGIGEKGAADLLRTYGSLDAVLENVASIKGKRPREALQAGAELARLSRELSRLREDLPIAFDPEAMAVRDPDVPALAELFRELELRRLLETLGDVAPATPRVTEPLAPVELTLVATHTEAGQLAKQLGERDPLGLELALEPELPMSGTLVAAALAADATHAALVPVRSTTESLEALRPLFESPERTWVGGDLKAAYVALARRGIRLAGRLCDTALAAYVADPSQPADKPEFLARTYLGRDWKPAEDRFGKGAKRRPYDTLGDGELGEHFGGLAALRVALHPELESALARTEQLDLYRELEVPLVGVLARMELAGVRIDEAKLAALGKRLEQEIDASTGRIYSLAGGEFNIGSPKQLQHVLFEKLALPPTKKTKTGFSTDETVLEELALSHELPREILAHRQLSKMKSTYVDSLPTYVHPETGRIHGSFDQAVAATGRLSSSRPNLQNIPIRTALGQEIRAAFVPAEGRVMFSADYSQIELRILAHLSKDPELVKAFQEGADIHVRTASQVFGVPESAVTPEQRARTKAINFGIIYGQSGFGLARTLGIAQAEARAQIDAYFQRYPGVREFIRQAIESAQTVGFARTMSGRRRYLPDLRSHNRVMRQAAERMAVNSVIQGTAADAIKRAMIQIDKDLAQGVARSARMILTVHDELVFEVAPSDLPALRTCVTERMQRSMELCVPLVVHAESGPNWLAAH